jgi:hypothetical protein
MSGVREIPSSSTSHEKSFYPVNFGRVGSSTVEKRQDISYSYGPESSTSNAFTEEDVTDDSGSKVSSDSIANGMSEGFRVSVADILEQGNYSPSHKHTFEVNDEFVHNKVKQRPRSHSHDSLQGSSKMADRTGDRYYGTPPKSLLGEHRSHTQSVLGDAYRMRSKAYPRSRSSFMAMTHTMSDDLQEVNHSVFCAVLYTFNGLNFNTWHVVFTGECILLDVACLNVCT